MGAPTAVLGAHLECRTPMVPRDISHACPRGEEPAPISSHGGHFPMPYPSFLCHIPFSLHPMGTPKSTPASHQLFWGQEGKWGAVCSPSRASCRGYLWVGNAWSQRNCWDCGGGGQKEAAKNNLRGNTGVRFCPKSAAVLLGRTFPHHHSQCPHMLSSGMLGHHHPGIPILGPPLEWGWQSQGFF